MPPDLKAWRTVRLHIPNMDCASEEAEIRKAVEKIEGLSSLRFQLAARTLEISVTETGVVQAVEAIRDAGFASTVLPSGPEQDAHGTGKGGFCRYGGELARGSQRPSIDREHQEEITPAGSAHLLP